MVDEENNHVNLLVAFVQNKYNLYMKNLCIFTVIFGLQFPVYSGGSSSLYEPVLEKSNQNDQRQLDSELTDDD